MSTTRQPTRSGSLGHLVEQLQQNMESQLAEWVHSTEDYPNNLWLSCEYATKACHRTGARVHMDRQEFNHHMQHPYAYIVNA